MAIPPGTHLITTDCVRAILGLSADVVQSLADEGRLRFVWNLNAQPRNRQIPELRFWLQEVLAPLPVRLTLADAIHLILGERRTSWRGVEVAQMLLVSRPCIHHLRKARALVGEITGHTLWIQRPALEKFLTERWLGSVPPPRPGN